MVKMERKSPVRSALMPAARTAARTAAELLYPRRCPVCDRPVRPFGEMICADCEGVLQRVGKPACLRCGKPLGLPGEQLCGDCRRYPHFYDRGCAVFVYHSTAGGLFRFKYGGRREYGAYYGKCMAEKLAAFCRELAEAQGGGAGAGSPRAWFDMLVPVPLSARRLEKRGFNQAEILAGEVSRRTGIPLRGDVLRRTSDTLPMKNMGPLERQNNLKKAFQCTGNDVKLSSIMLIDDIYTTGATIDACAQALYRQGAGRVCFMTLAIGGEPDTP